ncbi:MAG: hypothetical protein ACQSGP_12200 [Frankia sp.]
MSLLIPDTDPDDGVLRFGRPLDLVGRRERYPATATLRNSLCGWPSADFRAVRREADECLGDDQVDAGRTGGSRPLEPRCGSG